MNDPSKPELDESEPRPSTLDRVRDHVLDRYDRWRERLAGVPERIFERPPGFAGERRARRWRLALQGVPAIVAAGLVYAAAAARPPSAAELIDRYQRAADAAMSAKDYEAARVYADRLVELDEERPESIFRLALAWEALGDEERSATLVDRLARQEAGNYPPAHLWMARRLLASPKPSQEQLAAAQAHLERAVRSAPRSADADALLGKVLLARGRAAEAAEHLERAAEAMPELHLVLARVYAQLNDAPTARAKAEHARDLFKRRVERDLDDRTSRIRWAEAAAMLGDLESAARVLNDGLALAPNDETIRKMLAGTHAALADQFENDPAAGRASVLAAWREAVRVDPWNELVLQRLLARSHDEGPLTEAARAELSEMLAQGDMPATVHMILGNDAYARGALDEARRHLDLACQLDPGLAVAANNLAWLLAHGDPPELERALHLITSVLTRFPDMPAYRDTRGRILAKLHRYDEALADLESALVAFPGDKDLHSALADAYEGVGQKGLAAEHRRLARDAGNATDDAAPR